jgi:hypothetical protein
MAENNEIILGFIKENNFRFDRNIYYNNLSKLNQDIEPLIEFKSIKFTDMMEKIVEFIGLTPELIGHSPTCNETLNNIYQICFIGTENNENNSMAENTLASYLVGEKVLGNAVFISSIITKNFTCTPDNANIDTVSNILYSKFIHSALIIKADDAIDEFKYFDHPIEYYKITKEEDFNNYKILEFEYFGFSLCMIIELNPNVPLLNKNITRLYGKEKINGDVILISKSTHEYYDLSIDVYKKMVKLSYGPIKSRDLKEEDTRENEKIEGLPLAINKYIILENRLSKFKKSCNYCNSLFSDEVLICSGCYRLRYHASECQKNDWNTHKSECLHNKKSLNDK